MFHRYWNGSVHGITHENKILCHRVHAQKKKKNEQKKNIVCTAQSAFMPLSQVTEVGYHDPGYQTLSDHWKSWRGGQDPHILHKRVQGGLK